jgi:hypothetical protein
MIGNLTSLVDTYVQANMLWWVSGTALVGAMIAGAWVKRDELAAEGWRRWVVFFNGLCFLSTLVAYGAYMAAVGSGLSSAVAERCPEASAACDGIRVLVSALPAALWIGTSSFFLALLGWTGIFTVITRRRRGV